MQVRFMTEFSPQGIKIVDVFIMNTMYLGHMSEKEFNAGFEEKSPEPEAPKNVLENLLKPRSSPFS